MLIILYAALACLMFMAWAMGGEEGFGKWRRGLLLSLPMSLYGLMAHMPWYLYPIQIIGLCGLYQCLFYGKAISRVYDDHDPRGWWLIGLNGLLIGLTPLVLAFARHSISMLPTSIIICTLGFMGVVRFANDPKFKSDRDWMAANLPWKFKDAWFDCEGVMGLLIALAIMM